MIHKIIQGDCTKKMLTIPTAKADLFITDPPFGINFKSTKANYNRNQERVLQGYIEVDQADYLDFSLSWMQQAFRILKNTGSMFVFSGYNNLKDILIALDETGFTTINHIIWKYQFGVRTKTKFVASHYHLLYVCKDPAKRKFYPWSRFKQEDKNENGSSKHYLDKEDVWTIKREYWTNEIKTPTKLPSAIIRKILEYTTVPNDLVIDPFIGSGQVAYVCRQMKRSCIGIETVKAYCDFANDRLAKL